MNRSIRVLFTIPNFKTAGSQYVLLALIERLEEKNVDVFVGIENHWDYATKVISEHKLVKLPRLYQVSKISFIKQYIYVLKNNHVDFVHSWDYKSNYLEPMACRLAGVKYLYTKKNNSWSRSWRIKSFLSHFIAYDQPKMKTRFFYNKHFKNKIKLIPHGIDLLKFFPLEKIPRATFNLCYLGNINFNKNQLFVLKAMLNLPENIHLNVFGKADLNYKKKLDLFVEANNLKDRVHFFGYIAQNELPEIFRKQDVLVLSSLEEGFPVCLLEAMACGIPVLSSDSGGGARFMLKNMVQDCLFSINQIDDFVHKILNLMANEDLYDSLRRKGLEIVHSKFSIELEVNSYVKLYNKI